MNKKTNKMSDYKDFDCISGDGSESLKSFEIEQLSWLQGVIEAEIIELGDNPTEKELTLIEELWQRFTLGMKVGSLRPLSIAWAKFYEKNAQNEEEKLLMKGYEG